ncbi:uncharacterized protein BDZ99DRAFT_273797 [Mytilinidion resinicola]|uniref:Uncharacterized protein n=1 Tax=Mytilinidion resinicola TaxID=574789 RepID=A0A6A6YTU4_9PEZI|nr:uncharacterized protein BDZ99DRAFT_273797 [Mytilinidion resinicola]KAF2811327.1 hypothetical protein BDZ99DRAFT_273797 [Mytilinidion resinicola]
MPHTERQYNNKHQRRIKSIDLHLIAHNDPILALDVLDNTVHRTDEGPAPKGHKGLQRTLELHPGHALRLCGGRLPEPHHEDQAIDGEETEEDDLDEEASDQDCSAF